jgi:glycosyltransferase involved in cell wall biosynthesis
MRVALVHDWLTGMRGGERVLEELIRLFPDAEIFTLVHQPGSVSRAIEGRPIHTSLLDRMPLGRSRYRWFLPLMPRAVAAFDLRGFDLVVSSSHCVAKGAPVPAGVPHLCYCHTPMRYVWDQYDAYWGAGRAPAVARAAMRLAAPGLRRWDVVSSNRVTRFVANSDFVRERIERYYGRDAAVVHPPVSIDRFTPERIKGDAYLVLGALAPYKRVDLAVEAFRGSGRRLIVAGQGTRAKALRRAAGPETTFLGRVSDERAAELLGRARALLLPGVEDFGITAVEALASGTPVVALGHGGVRASVCDPETGVFFHEPTVPALRAALERFESISFDTNVLSASVRRFAPERFRDGIRAEVHALMGGR